MNARTSPDALLEQIPDAALTAGQQLGGVDGLDVMRQDQHPEAGVALARVDRRAQTLVAERRRQPHVDDRDVPLVARDDALQPRPVFGLSDDVDAVLAQRTSGRRAASRAGERVRRT